MHAGRHGRLPSQQRRGARHGADAGDEEGREAKGRNRDGAGREGRECGNEGRNRRKEGRRCGRRASLRAKVPAGLVGEGKEGVKETGDVECEHKRTRVKR